MHSQADQSCTENAEQELKSQVDFSVHLLSTQLIAETNNAFGSNVKETRAVTTPLHYIDSVWQQLLSSRPNLTEYMDLYF